MRASLVACVVLALAAGACREPSSPPPPPQRCPVCPAPDAEPATGEDPYQGYSFRLVGVDGRAALVGTSSKGRVVVIPLDPRARVFADGKPGTAAELLMFRRSGGGCPCRYEHCVPYCHTAGRVLELPKDEFYGEPNVPDWPPFPELDQNGDPTSPVAPPPGTNPPRP